MPWLVGDESSCEVVNTDSDAVALSDLMRAGAPEYVGYLLSGFAEALRAGSFRPARMGLAFRCGWRAVAVTARTDDAALAAYLGSYHAPAPPRPHLSAPLGFTLFSTEWLSEVMLPAFLEERSSELALTCRLNALLSRQDPVLCDPVLELALTGRTLAEERACSYRRPRLLQGTVAVVRGLWRPSCWETGAPALGPGTLPQ